MKSISIEDIRTWLPILTGVAAIIVASLGLITWKMQLVANANSSAVLKLGEALLVYRTEIWTFRNPFITGSEASLAIQEFAKRGIDPDENLKKLAGKSMRQEQLDEAYNNLLESGFGAEFLFGQEATKRISAIAKLHGEISYSMWILRSNLEDPEGADKEATKMAKSIVYSREDDEFSVKVDDAIADLRHFLLAQTPLAKHRWRIK